MHRCIGLDTPVEIVLRSRNVTTSLFLGKTSPPFLSVSLSPPHYREFLTDNRVGEMFIRVGKRPIDRCATTRTRFENRWHRIHLRSTTPCPDPINDPT